MRRNGWTTRVGAALAAAGLLVTLGAVGTSAGAASATAGTGDWPAYLFGPAHSSDNQAATAINPTTASSLNQAWTFVPDTPPVPSLGEAINASPTVVDGVVYIGANDGTFYALDEATGAVLWQTAIGYESYSGCGSRGITATATVATDPATQRPTVYVSSGSGYLYALDAATGAVVWRSVIALPTSPDPSYTDYSSPTVTNGKIYIGVAGECTDHVRGALLSYAQSTGKRLASYFTVPAGESGGSVWSSAAVAANGGVYFGTGNDIAPTPANAGTSEAIVEVNPTTLHRIGSWQLPLADQPSDDSDFGASVTLFDAALSGTTTETPMVGACNKNGVFYAFRQGRLAAGPVWQARIAKVNTADNGMAAACLASAVPDGKQHLFVAATATAVNRTSYAGSVRELNAATGKVVWAHGLPAPVLGTPSLDGAGVLSVATYGGGSEPSADYLIDAASGATLATLDNGNSPEFSQPVIAGNYVLLATQTAGLIAYRLPGSG